MSEALFPACVFLLGYIWLPSIDESKDGMNKIAGTVVILKGNRVSINQENNDYAGGKADDLACLTARSAKHYGTRQRGYDPGDRSDLILFP